MIHEAHVLRGGRTESVHRVAVAVTEAAGDGAPEVFLRSVAKPLQALPAVRADVPERLGLDDRHVALGCASHGGGEEHVALVRQALSRAGADEDALGCGPLAPRDPRLAGVAPSRVRHNCSGKHALAICLCRVAGWPRDGYWERSHPLEEAMYAAMVEMLGAGDMPAAIDGCGLPTFVVGLDRVAHAYAALAHGDDPALARVAGAMRAHPGLIAYDGAIDTELMRAAPGLVAKIGAEGLLAVGTADGRGFAFKVLDGSDRALAPVALAVLREHLDLPPLPALDQPAVMNSRGVVVGEIVAARG